MKFLIRAIITGIVIYYSHQELQSPVTTFIFILLFAALEAINWMLMFISRQATALGAQLVEIRQALDEKFPL